MTDDDVKALHMFAHRCRAVASTLSPMYAAEREGELITALLDERDRLMAERDEHMASVRAVNDEADALKAERDTLAALLLRYRREVPLGHQPHMIAEDVDAALGEPR